MKADRISKPTHYDVLGVSRCASPDEIRGAYRHLAHFWRPEANVAPRAKEMTVRLRCAWETLQDIRTREEYDALLKVQEEHEAKLQAAVRAGDLRAVEACIKDDPNLVCSSDQNGLSPLHLAASFGHLNVVQLLLAGGADIDARNNAGWTCLHEAAYSGHCSVTTLLIANRADVNARSNGGLTPLHYAAAYGHADVAKVLLSNRADVHEKTNEGWTCLHEAACSGWSEVAELLLANGTDINARSNEGQTALDYAAAFGHGDVANLIRTYGGHE